MYKNCQHVSTCGGGVGRYNSVTNKSKGQEVNEKKERAVNLVKHTDHVLDVTLSIDESTFYIYDLSCFWRFSDEREQARYRQRFAHVISGKAHTVNIICDRKELTYDKARKIAIKHIEKSLAVYRLD